MSDPNRGRIPIPNLDDRVWADIVNEAKALIPTYAPQWTDYNPSDLGITLIELFAWMVEGLTYRLNRVPDKNYIAFLNLLGITRDPQTPSEAFLTFTAQPGGPVVVPKGQRAQTQGAQGSEAVAPIVFETDADLIVLPANLKVALQTSKPWYSNLSSSFTVPPALGASVTIPTSQSVQVVFGFDNAPAQPFQVMVRLFAPVIVEEGFGPWASVDWVYSTGVTEPGAWPVVPILSDETKQLQTSGVVSVTPPNSWGSQIPTTWHTLFPGTPQDLISTPYFWLAARIHNLTAHAIQVGFNWVLFNAVSSHNALTIPAPEPLGVSTGAPFQVFALKNQPLYRLPDTDTPYSHLQVQVNNVSWTQVEDFAHGAGQVYRVDPVAGEISFGNFNPNLGTGNGSIPPLGNPITAQTYRYAVGGNSGNVGAGAINQLRTPVAGISEVQNLFSAFDGADAESIEDTKRRAPFIIRNRYRAVVAEDYEFLAKESSSDVVIVRCLEPRIHDDDNKPFWTIGDPWTFGGIDRSPGNVNVIVVSDMGPNAPRPTATPEVLGTVLRYLDKRHDLTARLTVKVPRYAPVDVVVNASVWTSAITGGLITGSAALQAQIQLAIENFLHPIHGGVEGKGWQVGQHVFIADIFKAIQPAEEVGFISSLTLAGTQPTDYHNPPIGQGGPWDPNERPFPLSAPGAWVRLADYELVCFGSHLVTVTQV